jgi:outer membrane receptor protein involved in Fe transport
MTLPHPFPRALVLAVLAFGYVPTAYAVEEHIDEVLVTATRRSVAAAEISAAVSMVDVDALRGHKLITDALSGSPGVFLQQTTPGQGAAIIRGQKGSSILHLVDGLRLNNAIFRSAPTQYLALVPVTAVERIEILRGTPASLYGSDAIGGVVQVVTRVPHFDSQDSKVRGDLFAGFDSAESGRTIRGIVDIGNERVVTSVSAEFLQTDDRKTGGGQRVGPSGYESKAGRFLMALTPDERNSWLFDMQFLEQPTTPRVDELVAGFGQTEPSSSEYFFAPNRRLFAHVRYDLAGGPLELDWRVDASWQRIDDDRITRNFQSSIRRVETNRSDLTGFMVSASRNFSSGSWIAGAEYYHDSVSSNRLEQDLGNGQSTSVAARFPDGSSVDQAAIFANVEGHLSDRNSLSGGIRVSSVDVTLPQTVVSPAASVDTTDASGDIGWIFDLSAVWQLVANVGFGFRAPNVFDLGTLGNRPGNRFNIPNTNLKSERALQADFGVRYRAERLQLEIMLYSLRYDDRIVSVLTGDVTPDGRDVVQSVNAAEATVRGAEFGLEWQLTQNVEAAAVLNYTWGEQTAAGQTEPADRIPPLSGRLNIAWDNGGAFRVDTWARFANVQDRLSARDVRDIRIDPDGTAGWGIIGISAAWRPTVAWTLTAGIDNLLDKRYRSHGSGLDAPGRNLSVSVRRVW